jgi:WD40 repeat protein
VNRLTLNVGTVGSFFPVAVSPDGRTLASGGTIEGLKLWDVATGTQRSTLIGNDSEYGGPLAFSPDSQTLASGHDRGVRRWNVPTGTRLRGLDDSDPQSDLSQRERRALTFSPDGRILAWGNRDRRIRMWEVATGV